MDLQGQCWRRWDGWCWNKCSCWAVYWRRSGDWRIVLLQVWAIDDQSTEQHWIQPKVLSWVLWNLFLELGRACWWHSRQVGADVLWARRLVCTVLVWWLFPSIWWTQWGRIVCVFSLSVLLFYNLLFVIYFNLSFSLICFSSDLLSIVLSLGWLIICWVYASTHSSVIFHFVDVFLNHDLCPWCNWKFATTIY